MPKLSCSVCGYVAQGPDDYFGLGGCSKCKPEKFNKEVLTAAGFKLDEKPQEKLNVPDSN